MEKKIVSAIIKTRSNIQEIIFSIHFIFLVLVFVFLPIESFADECKQYSRAGLMAMNKEELSRNYCLTMDIRMDMIYEAARLKKTDKWESVEKEMYERKDKCDASIRQMEQVLDEKYGVSLSKGNRQGICKPYPTPKHLIDRMPSEIRRALGY